MAEPLNYCVQSLMMHKYLSKRILASMAKAPMFAAWYASEIGKRFPAGEVAIATNPKAAFFYALSVIKGPWPEGEAAIASDSGWAAAYSRELLKGPFILGEAAIKASDRREIRQYLNSLAVIYFPWEAEAMERMNLSRADV